MRTTSLRMAETATPSRLLLTEAAEWAQGRMWVPRLPLLLWLAWILKQHLHDPLYSSLFSGLNLGVHELGHFLFAPFGETLAVAGGTIAQCLLPLGAMLMFYRQRDFFAIAVALCWLGINFFGIAAYVGDARAQVLPLVSPVSGDPIHDWWYLLSHFGALENDRIISRRVYDLGVATMALGLVFGAWLLWQMAFSKTKEGEGRKPAPPPAV
jgi:hypothetical protein